MPFRIECISDAITVFFSSFIHLWQYHFRMHTQPVLLEYICIFFRLVHLKVEKGELHSKTHLLREHTYSRQNIGNINFISLKEIAADLCHFVGRENSSHSLLERQIFSQIFLRAHNFFCVFVDAVIFVVVVAGSKLIFKWFNQCDGSSFKSKIILSLQRQISCPYLSFFFCMHTHTHMSV